MTRIAWAISGTVALIGAVVNIPFVIEGYMFNGIVFGWLLGIAACQYAASVMAR